MKTVTCARCERPYAVVGKPARVCPWCRDELAGEHDVAPEDRRCSGCDRTMSQREYWEQRMCNDCVSGR